MHKYIICIYIYIFVYTRIFFLSEVCIWLQAIAIPETFAVNLPSNVKMDLLFIDGFSLESLNLNRSVLKTDFI